MKAQIDNQVIADSDDIVERGGYQYFPASAVRLDWLEKTSKTPRDLECPHGVQFYDVVVDGVHLLFGHVAAGAILGAWR